MTVTSIYAAEQQCLIVEKTDLAEVSYALAGVQRIEFNDGQMVVVRKDNTEAPYDIDQLKKLKFAVSVPTKAGENISPDTAGSDIAVYPNPTADYLIIKGLQADSKAIVYTMNGKTILESVIMADDATVHVESLDKGCYLLMIDNTVVRFIKK